ncbi:mechanosensitive ion channel [Gottschalkia acidurici 9a]|uniref:Mechanosensitive ion channel n=1 Tax=Gottschalkia acidurici (strain ATCC 7906 / DSM 604 / BCRC 14475 / CIP 104303 / KCTC 5404 / NCIMB 10678 / 9a) TaxID=1128398 RepID=K0B1I2_GOTA9|nr:mechanosensitive ion channel family protein [Gottschalkia acidurici]AFS79848.1 mechanosensitive ion channel [Gottschalkia acidurici 9a]
MIEVFNEINRWLLGEDKHITILEKTLKIAIILICVKIITKISYVMIDKFFKRQQNLKIGIEERKANTLAIILKSLCKYIFYFIALIPILDQFGIETKSILATAGVGGLAIGFGAQSLVKDVITGFFILFEDYFSVGDYIQTGEYEGVVEEIGIRSTRIRDFSGDLHIMPNGKIEIVTNRSRGDMRALVEVRINYEEDIDKALRVLERVAQSMSNEETIVSGPKVLGVTSLTKEGITLSMMAMTRPMEQWQVERNLRKAIKEEFQKHGISINDRRKVVLERDDLL